MHFNSQIEPLPSAMESEVAAIIHSVNFDPESRSYRRDLSRHFRILFEHGGWKRNTNLHFEDAKKTPHYIKNRILAQVTWRHYGMIGTEMLKFQIEYTRGLIDAGVYICITDEFLKFFNRFSEAKDGRKSFRGSTTMQKAHRYLNQVSSEITVPLAIIGLLPP